MYFIQSKSQFIPYYLKFRIITLDKFQQQIMGLQDSCCTLYPKGYNLSSQKFNMIFNFVYPHMMLYLMKLLQLFTSILLIIKIQFFDYKFNVIVFQSLYMKRLHLYKFIIMSQIINYRWAENISLSMSDFQIKFLVDVFFVICFKINIKYLGQHKTVVIKMIQQQHLQNQVRQNQESIIGEHIIIVKLLNIVINWQRIAKGGWKPGDESCIIGYVVALCEMCDLYNSRESRSYSVSSADSSGSCDLIAYNVITIIFVSLWTLISTLMSISSTIEMIEEFVKGISLKEFGVRVAIKEAQTAILIKVFTNYLQIISTISNFQFQVPARLASVSCQYCQQSY
ncbi:unnamed protein product [Paramecium pentaurelia]|uniref:Uncharacterized protein n=1 Tax=Paramecium pentaurelia TaxID=43138 RepID=A0A8S1YCE4_9CILI|nr:unnamed protein product [Paramecium pentaurelia]